MASHTISATWSGSKKAHDPGQKPEKPSSTPAYLRLSTCIRHRYDMSQCFVSSLTLALFSKCAVVTARLTTYWIESQHVSSHYCPWAAFSAIHAGKLRRLRLRSRTARRRRVSYTQRYQSNSALIWIEWRSENESNNFSPVGQARTSLDIRLSACCRSPLGRIQSDSD